MFVSGAISASLGPNTVGFYGTASWAQNALTASFITASNVYGPFGSSSVQSASYASSSTSASFAGTASLAFTASFITGAGVFGPFGSNSVQSASYASSSTSASYALFSTSASYAENARPAPEDTWIQYNKKEAFGAESYFRYIYDSHSFQQGSGVESFGSWSHAQGNNTKALGIHSHTEGDSTYTGVITGYSASISSGVVILSDVYGNISSNFSPGVYLWFVDNNGSSDISRVDSVTYSSPNTIITLSNLTINKSRAVVGDIFTYPSFWSGDQKIGVKYSHAEGDSNFALGAGSHAEGGLTVAGGVLSHTEGWETYAIGLYSHAEGLGSATYNIASHAEGHQTITYGKYSHAEGYNTQAIDEYSHAEGWQTIAYGTASHAEGYQTIASGSYSHTEGDGNSAHGTSSHAEGKNNTVFSDHSHVEGEGNIIHPGGTYGSHAEGRQTQIIDLFNINFVNGAHTEGFYTTASNQGTHAEGIYSHAGGPLGFGAHAEGENTFSSGRASHTEGYKTIASGFYSHAEGSGSIALGIASHAEGNNTTASGDYQLVIGQFNKSLPSQSAFIIGDGTADNARHNVLFISKSWFEASASNVYFQGLPENTSSLVLVYDSSSGRVFYTASNAVGGTGTPAPQDTWIQYNSGSTFGATGSFRFIYTSQSFQQGSGVTAPGRFSHAQGSASVALGTASHTEGLFTIASGSFQTVVGQYNVALPSQSAFIIGDGFTTSSIIDSDTLQGGTDIGEDIFVIDDNVSPPSALVGGTLTVTGVGTETFTILSVTPGLSDYQVRVTPVAAQKFNSPNPYIITVPTIERHNLLFASQSWFDVSASNVFLRGIPTSSEPHILSYHSESGQVYYMPTFSLNPAPEDTYIQYNSGSKFGAEQYFRYIYTSHSLQQGNEVTASGYWSHAEGSASVALGTASHAEGFRTTASGDYSHAEGRGAKAIGESSHAEGNSTISFGGASHAEGFQTTASGSSAHAEGSNTVALGLSSHAEGSASVALGIASHTEGLFTIASGSFQTVVGQYNIANTSQSAFIIGDGTADNARHNVLFASQSHFEVSASNVYFQGLPQTSSNFILVYDSSSGQVFYTASTSYTITASNGLTFTPGTPDQIKLGGILTQNTTINADNDGNWYSLNLVGDDSDSTKNYIFTINNDRPRSSMLISNTRTGGATPAVGLSILSADVAINSSTTGELHNARFVSDKVNALQLRTTSSSLGILTAPSSSDLDNVSLLVEGYNHISKTINGIPDTASITMIHLYRNSSYAPANGAAGSIDYSFDISGNDFERRTTRLVSLLDEANASNGLEGSFEIHTLNSNSLDSKLRIDYQGQLTLNKYTASNSFDDVSGTSVGVLHADNTGKIFISSSGGGGTSTPPAPSDTYIQYNENDSFGAEEYFRYIYNSHSLQQGSGNTIIGQYSHAEGESTQVGWKVITASSIVDGLIEIYDGVNYNSYFGANNTNLILGSTSTNKVYKFRSKTYSAPTFSLQLYDTSINGTGTWKYLIGIDVTTVGHTSLGGYSHAEGFINEAIGDYSHVEGAENKAIGYYSHAEGVENKAIGNYSHAEGVSTQAIGQYSHAEGGSTITIGDYSHAEGNTTIAGYKAFIADRIVSGTASFYNDINNNYNNEFTGTEVLIGGNYYTFRSESYSAPTYSLYLNDPVTITTNRYVVPIVNPDSDYANQDAFYGDYSHAEGRTAYALGDYSHAEGYLNYALGYYSHAEGYNNKAIGGYSHAEGEGNKVFGSGSHVEGRVNYIHETSRWSHVGGLQNSASGWYQTVFGQNNVPIPSQSAFMIGGDSFSTPFSDRWNMFVAVPRTISIDPLNTVAEPSDSIIEMRADTASISASYLYVPNLTNPAQTNVLTYNPVTGRVHYTSSTNVTGTAINVDIKNQGNLIASNPTFINFTGSGVTASINGAGVNVFIPGGGGGSGTITGITAGDGLSGGGSSGDITLTLNSTSSAVGGAGTSYTINHNFGTRNVHVTVYSSSGTYETVYPDIQRPTTNSVEVLFNNVPAAGEFIVYISR
jgi:hypothetical protein